MVVRFFESMCHKHVRNESGFAFYCFGISETLEERDPKSPCMRPREGDTCVTVASCKGRYKSWAPSILTSSSCPCPPVDATQ